MSSEVEAVFRREWGRAVAVVARITGDLGLAEDAVQDRRQRLILAPAA